MKAIPNIFATQPSGNVPASYLDVDFALIADAGTFSNYFVDSGAANAYVVTFAAGETGSLTAGLMIQFLASADNTGASTLAVNGMTAKNITNYDATALTAGQIKANAVVMVIYDGTQFKLVTQFTGGKVPGLADFSSGGIKLGTNHLSYGGTAAGLSFDSGNNATFSAGISVTGLETNGFIQSPYHIIAPIPIINASTGALTSIGAAVASGAGPQSVAVDPTGRFVYVANYGAATVSMYSINASTGALTSIGAAVASGAGPYGVAVDPTGRFVYVANYGASTVSMYVISNFMGGAGGFAGPLTAGAFGCNGNAAQTKYASGGTLAGVVAALVANGILSN